jgi:hypothetical protein
VGHGRVSIFETRPVKWTREEVTVTVEIAWSAILESGII